MTESAPASSPNYGYVPQSTAPFNVLSIVAFVLSLVGFNIIAVVLGHIAMSQLKRSGERGRGFAIAALVIGYVSIAAIVLFFIILIAILIPAGLAAGSGSSY
ncbi:MAG: DUF4190 domain-containing protein [Naasia sp.]